MAGRRGNYELYNPTTGETVRKNLSQAWAEIDAREWNRYTSSAKRVIVRKTPKVSA